MRLLLKRFGRLEQTPFFQDGFNIRHGRVSLFPFPGSGRLDRLVLPQDDLGRTVPAETGTLNGGRQTRSRQSPAIIRLAKEISCRAQIFRSGIGDSVA